MEKWTYKICYNEAKKYKLKKDFRRNAYMAYIKAWRKGWLKDYDWLESINIFSDKVDTVYCYLFEDFKAVYVGRTLKERIKIRDYQHRNNIYNDKHRNIDSVKRFAIEHNVELPPMSLLEENITLEEGQKLEGYWVEHFREMGYHIINIAKTGSLGTLDNGKWTKETCYEEAKKYKTKTEFSKHSNGAYDSARRHGWLDDYTWFIRTNLLWTEKTCYEEAKKYKTRLEFFQNNCSAYDSARRHGWLDDYTWFISHTKWTKETCYEEAKKYKTKTEFKKKSPSAYSISIKNKWIKNYTWLITNINIKIKWTEKTCYEEAKKYYSRSEFQKGNKSAYMSSLKQGWIENYIWFNKKHNNWTKETCYEEAKKYKTLKELRLKNQYIYKISYKNKWLIDYYWLK